MPRLDAFIERLHQRRADSLQAVPGRPLTLVRGSQVGNLTAKPLGPPQIRALLAEVVDPSVADRLVRESRLDFPYRAPTGPVRIEWSNDGEQPSFTVVPDEDSAGGMSSEAEASTRSDAPPSSSTASAAPEIDPEARRALDDLLRAMVDAGASDLHLRVGEPPILRKDGSLERMDRPALGADLLGAMHRSVMPDEDRVRFDRSGDADYAHEITGLARFRANAAMDRNGPMGVFRVIPDAIPTCEQMGIAPELQKLCFLHKGLVLVTGPTGSGKSTTLAAMVDLMNEERSDHILTIEDPIEFVHPSKGCLVTHRQVGLHTESFKSGLRAALREDPDIVLIGELRDLETVAIAIETAETGHLVFGTLHTTTAASTVDRLIDQFPADQQSQIRVMLSESLRGVISQTLCKRVGGGRVAAREVLLSTSAVSNLIREGKTFQLPSIMQTSRKHGMITLNDALLELVDEGLVASDEAWRKAVDKPGIEAGLKTRGLPIPRAGD
ncbi:type IV pilus twitching motility protein PilT [Gaopeijia maritima]|uniref:Type IV pilus twitching motility protein PilT n=1 Tax=Gaopeijia maritima TaxID=3119007 RepID=A0ABU9ED56_9BACT